ncbi:MAG: dTMP kinase [Nitrospinae bacterium]|nr:dTMP kinase [Nitrospinota bacterium]
MTGVFITFEGIEGSGKSTQINLLADRLRADGWQVVVTREPGGTPAGQALRKILLDPATGSLDSLTELLLFSAARRELVSKIIAPAVSAGQIVLCDRFADSTVAYQGYGRGMDISSIKSITQMVCGDAWPDKTIILDLPVEDGLKRASARFAVEGHAEARFEYEGVKFHIRVREGFQKIAQAEPERVTLIGATGDVEDVALSVYESVKRILPARNA